MPEVDVSILGRRFKVACDEDEVEATREAAQMFLKHVEKCAEGARDAGISQLLLVAGISQSDSILNPQEPEGEGQKPRPDAPKPADSMPVAPESLDALAKLVESAERIADELEASDTAGRKAG